MNIVNIRSSASIPNGFHVDFTSLEKCQCFLDVIFKEIVPLVLKNRGLYDQSGKVASLSGDDRAKLLKLYAVLDQVMLFLKIDKLNDQDTHQTTSNLDIAAFNCLSDACYVMMLFNDARSHTSHDDISYYLKFAVGFAKSSIVNAMLVIPKPSFPVDRLADQGVVLFE